MELQSKRNQLVIKLYFYLVQCNNLCFIIFFAKIKTTHTLPQNPPRRLNRQWPRDLLREWVVTVTEWCQWVTFSPKYSRHESLFPNSTCYMYFIFCSRGNKLKYKKKKIKTLHLCWKIRVWSRKVYNRWATEHT